MQRGILVPLDGSSFGEQALPVAQAIARRLDAGLALVEVSVPAVVQLPETGWANVEVVAKTEAILKNQARDYLEAIAARLTADCKMPVTATVGAGMILEGILEQAERNRPELIVMTTHGRGPLSRFWLGSVADQLIRHSPVPILLIRPEKEASQTAVDPLAGHVLIALDGSPLSEQVLSPVAALAAAGQARLTLVRVVESPVYQPAPGSPQPSAWPHLDVAFARTKAAEYLEATAAPLRSKGFRVETLAVTGSPPAAVILEQAAQLQCTAVALVTHARAGLPRLLVGSVADKVVRGATIPVLVCHANDSASAGS